MEQRGTNKFKKKNMKCKETKSFESYGNGQKQYELETRG